MTLLFSSFLFSSSLPRIAETPPFPSLVNLLSPPNDDNDNDNDITYEIRINGKLIRQVHGETKSRIVFYMICTIMTRIYYYCHNEFNLSTTRISTEKFLIQIPIHNQIRLSFTETIITLEKVIENNV